MISKRIAIGLSRYLRQYCSYVSNQNELKSKYDVIIVGGGHNGLVSAAYLQKAGKKVCVLERRHLVGGAAVTEEIFPGFKYSRASYVLALLRPQILEELELEKYGLQTYLRDPYSYTPIRSSDVQLDGKSLLLEGDKTKTFESISQFSRRDAENFFKYEDQLGKIKSAIQPLLDNCPPNIKRWKSGGIRNKYNTAKKSLPIMKMAKELGKEDIITEFYEILTAPADKLLCKWFESEPLKATLATDSVIGAMMSPYSPGSGYVLLHHVMGDLTIEGVNGAWGYVKGGMGSVSNSIARSAKAKGVEIFTNTDVEEILVNGGRISGVLLSDGTEIKADVVLSNATSNVTYLNLIDKNHLPPEFIQEIQQIDYQSPVTKINVAVSRIPNFLANPSEKNQPMPHHRGTIHLNSESTNLIHEAYIDACNGRSSEIPVIEMTIPSSVDTSVAPPGAHVVQLFTQYTPYSLSNGLEWTEQKQVYADKIFEQIDAYAPGFKSSILHTDILTPPDLEKVFGLTGGNIFHGAMSLDQLFFQRPVPKYCDYRSPIKGLYQCGASTHPGGGVMGAAGKLCYLAVMEDGH